MKNNSKQNNFAKRLTSALTLAALLLPLVLSLLLTSCSAPGNDENSGSPRVICTIFPLYDFASEICGGDANVTMLLPPGTESHSYEPTPKDIIEISECDLFIYIGGESDSWIESILASMDKPPRTLSLMDSVETVTEETIEGMQTNENGGDEEYDEHIWTSPKNAVKMAERIEKELALIFPDKADDFSANSKTLIKSLCEIDEGFADFFARHPGIVMVFGDRFPFRYFADEYGVECYAAFPGCSGETEPSAATLAFLCDKITSRGINTVFYIEFSNHRVADALAEKTGAKIALFNSAHNVSADDLKNGVTYVSIMEQNLKTLKEVYADAAD